jgi:hypothetical protein
MEMFLRNAQNRSIGIAESSERAMNAERGKPNAMEDAHASIAPCLITVSSAFY